MTRIFRLAFLPFLVIMALVAGGAAYQTVSIVPFWEQNISMFKNYRHWGIDYFPILSPAMTVLWLVVVITGFRAPVPNRTLLYVGHLIFLFMMGTTFAYFAPFLLKYMGQPQPGLSDTELASMLHTWAKWDRVRQLVGLSMLPIYIYTYSRLGSVPHKEEPRLAYS